MNSVKSLKTGFTCPYCGEVYKYRQGLFKHHAKRHPEEEQAKPTMSRIACNEVGCSKRFNTLQDFRRHLTVEHFMEFNEEKLSFSSVEEFLSWKENYEVENELSFVKRDGSKKRQDREITYYYCHRSGIHQSDGTGKRHARDSCKMGFHCTASMTLTVFGTSDVNLVHCTTHYGHRNELKFLRLTKSERSMIQEMVADNFTPDVILDKIRDSLQDNVKRIHLVNRDDITNIVRAFERNCSQKHKNDTTSVKLLIEELSNLATGNPILHCKFEGEEDEELIQNIGKDDMFLVIQHPLQLEMMQRFGANGVCLDVSHDGTAFFRIATLLVVDDFGEGFPCAWLISNREDYGTLTEFFKLIYNQAGDINPPWFMSDDPEQYYKAWIDIFGPTRKLLCPWHVDRSWRKNLDLITDSDLQNIVYKSLCTLAMERDAVAFNGTLDQSMVEFSECPGTTAFAEYFATNYSKCPEQWATCYRLQAGADTDAHMQAFHRALKELDVKDKMSNRLDRCIQLLLTVVRNNGIDRIGKNVTEASRTDETEDRHRSSLAMSLDLVTRDDKGSYLVKNDSLTADYRVNIDANNPCELEDCPLRCVSCQVCVHSSSCDCMDSLIHGVVCKHVHLVCKFLQEERNREKMNEEKSLVVNPLTGGFKSVFPRIAPRPRLVDMDAISVSFSDQKPPIVSRSEPKQQVVSRIEPKQQVVSRSEPEPQVVSNIEPKLPIVSHIETSASEVACLDLKPVSCIDPKTSAPVFIWIPSSVQVVQSAAPKDNDDLDTVKSDIDKLLKSIGSQVKDCENGATLQEVVQLLKTASNHLEISTGSEAKVKPVAGSKTKDKLDTGKKKRGRPCKLPVQVVAFNEEDDDIDFLPETPSKREKKIKCEFVQ